LIAGDLFHRQPLLRELKEVNYLFSKLTKTKVVFIVGNHDYIRPDSYYRTFKWCANVKPLLEEEMQEVVFDELEVCIYGFSYYEKEIWNAFDAGSNNARGKRKYEILLLHGGDEKHIPLQKNQLLSSNYDYIALGHIHKPQILEKNRIAYAGALEPIDKNDVGPHGYIEGEITKTGVTIQFVACAARAYVHANIKVKSEMTSGALKVLIKQQIDELGSGNLYKIVLEGFRDPDILFDLDNMDVYGNILEIIDETNPAYDFNKLRDYNKGNILGRFIESLEHSDVGSLEYQALYEGVQAILETRE
ncbi:MAG: metallophosphoesterase, partial [Lachnospiraceae bacterium]|nr:metallophosphoesterase [Lachnospiraceae bacterium]